MHDSIETDPGFRAAIEEHFNTTIASIKPVGNGFHAAGYEIRRDGENPLFLRVLNPVGFGHDLASDRLRSFLEGAQALPHALPVHAVLGITQEGQLVDLSDLTEVIAIAEFLPPDATNYCAELRQNPHSLEEIEELAQNLKPKAIVIAEAMADIHSQKYAGTQKNAASLYQRATRAVIHEGELSAGILDLIDFSSTSWITPKEASNFVAAMMEVRFALGVHPERVTRIHGDFWANNMFFDQNQELIITDSRLVWGEPAIDAGWFVGEFLVRDLVHFGHFGEAFTRVAQDALQTYQQRTGDTDIVKFMALPYAFQALAESIFTEGLTDEQRRLIFATANGALQSAIAGESFDLRLANTYTDRGLEFLASSV